jgi:hypothetical protein
VPLEATTMVMMTHSIYTIILPTTLYTLYMKIFARAPGCLGVVWCDS